MLLASVSHEMLTPLNAIINLSGILQKKFEQSLFVPKRKDSWTSLSKGVPLLENAGIMRIINNSALLLKYIV